MKKLITLLLALLFILTACAPAVVEQAPAPVETPEPVVETTPEPTPTGTENIEEKSSKNTVILVVTSEVDKECQERVYLEEYCRDKNFDFCLIDDINLDLREKVKSEYTALINTLDPEKTVTVFIGIPDYSLIDVSYQNNIKVLVHNYDFFRFYGGNYPVERIIVNTDFDRFAVQDYAAEVIAEQMQGYNTLVCYNYQRSDEYGHFGTKMGELMGNFDIEDQMKITPLCTKGEEGLAEAFSYVDMSKNYEKVCLYSYGIDDEVYLEKIYEYGYTDKDIFHVDVAIINENSLNKLIEGKSDVLYGYLIEELQRLPVETIDRIFAGEEVEEYICVEPIILTSKEEAQAYYDEHFA